MSAVQSKEDEATFSRASDEELRAAGFDPTWIAEHDGEGPYAPIRIETTCGCCGSAAFGWTVVNLEDAIGHSQEWTHDEGETDAHETASLLNGAWRRGHQSGMAHAKRV
jgi:hypothetical protein